MCPKPSPEEQRERRKISKVKNYHRRLCLKQHLDEYYTPRPKHTFSVTFRAEYLCEYGYFHERLTYYIYRHDTLETPRLHKVVEDVSSKYERTIF